jgi:hypothetical protein
MLTRNVTHTYTLKRLISYELKMQLGFSGLHTPLRNRSHIDFNTWCTVAEKYGLDTATLYQTLSQQQQQQQQQTHAHKRLPAGGHTCSKSSLAFYERLLMPIPMPLLVPFPPLLPLVDFVESREKLSVREGCFQSRP